MWPRSWPQQSAKGSSNVACRLAFATRTWNPSCCTRSSWGRRSAQRHVRKYAPCNAVPASIPTTIPGFSCAAGSRVDAGASSSCAVGSAHVFIGPHAAAQPVGASPMAEGGERRRHGPSAYSSCLSNSFAHSILDIPNAQSTPTQPQSASPDTARIFLSSPAVAMPNELWAIAPGGVAGDADMGDLVGDEELERVFESIGEAEDCSRLESIKREAQEVLQLAAKTKRRPAGRTKLSSIKKTQWIDWTVNSTEWCPIKKWLPEACNADFLLAQETHLPKNALAAEESWMRLQGWRAGVAPVVFRSPHGEWVSTKHTARSKGSAGVMVAAALRHGLGPLPFHCNAARDHSRLRLASQAHRCFFLHLTSRLASGLVCPGLRPWFSWSSGCSLGLACLVFCSDSLARHCFPRKCPRFGSNARMARSLVQSLAGQQAAGITFEFLPGEGVVPRGHPCLVFSCGVLGLLFLTSEARAGVTGPRETYWSHGPSLQEQGVQ